MSQLCIILDLHEKKCYQMVGLSSENFEVL